MSKLAEIRAAVGEFHPKLEELPEWEAQIYTIKFAVVSCIWLTDLIAIAEAAEALVEDNGLSGDALALHYLNATARLRQQVAKVQGE